MAVNDRNEDPNAKYDRERCRVCGAPWRPFRDDHGRIFAGHPYGETCSRYRPAEAGPAEEAPAGSGFMEAVGVVHVNRSAH